MSLPMSSGKIRALEKELRAAASYDEWKELAIAHDDMTGMSQWRRADQTSMYDHVGIRNRVDRLRSLRAKHDNHGLLFALNEGIHGNMGGMGKPGLHTRAKFGTKQLIEDYIEEISSSLLQILHVDESEISFEEKLDFFKRASRCYGRTALMFSGAGALGHFHAGVAKALIEQNVLPSVISGSSAGSITAAMIGCYSRKELMNFFSPGHLSSEARREANMLDHLLGAQIDVRELELMIERLIPDLTFEEAFARTGIHINISIAPAEEHQTSRLLNAVTSPNVYIRKAIMASCAVPGVYPPVMLRAKNIHGESQPYLPSRKWIDGSVSDDMPAKRLARLYGVNHYIVSQINPLVLPFVNNRPVHKAGLLGIYRGFMRNLAREGVLAGRQITKRYAEYMPRANLAMNMIASVATQAYTGDINIFPSFRYFDPRKLLSHLKEDEILMLINEGERATWPRIEAIRTTSRIGHTLDLIMDEMREGEARKLKSARTASTASRRKAPARKTAAGKRRATTNSKVRSPKVASTA